MSNDIKHTPAPWELEPNHPKFGGFHIFVDDHDISNNETIADVKKEANAAHIVKCVNSHDALLNVGHRAVGNYVTIGEDLNTIVDHLQHWSAEKIKRHIFGMQANIARVREQTEAALKLAKGE